MEQYPERRENESAESYQKRVQDWQVRNPLPTEKIIPPAGGTLTVLQPRRPSGSYTHTPPKPQ